MSEADTNTDEPDTDSIATTPDLAEDIDLTSLSSIEPYEMNAKEHPESQVAKIKDSITSYGWDVPIVVDSAGVIIKGHGRYEAAQQLELDRVPVIIRDDLTDAEVRAARIADNRTNESEWDDDILADEIHGIGMDSAVELGTLGFEDDELGQLGFDDDDIDAMVEDDEMGLGSFTDIGGDDDSDDEMVDIHEAYQSAGSGRLFEDFIIPPFTTLDARKGYWQDRKKAWMTTGLGSTEGRDKGGGEDDVKSYTGISYGDGDTGVSVFDPVLSEICYRWFAPDNATIFDPFAGGLSRGTVASLLGHDYTGIDLNASQLDSNRELWDHLDVNADSALLSTDEATKPTWIHGDSTEMGEMDAVADDEQYDFIFTCPPYHDLEEYTDDPADISNMGYDDFIGTFGDIIDKAADRLKDNHFAVIVVGDIRDSDGRYRGLDADTIDIAREAGLSLYNRGILVTQLGTAAVRARNTFNPGRKLVKTHQSVLVFTKGTPDNSTIEDIYGESIVGDIDTETLAEMHTSPSGGGDADNLAPVQAPETLPESLDNTPELTPVEQHGDYYFKREDKYLRAGVNGSKVRGYFRTVEDEGAEGISAGIARVSPNHTWVAAVGKRLGIPVRLHTSHGDYTEPMRIGEALGAEIIQHEPGYMTNVRAKAEKDAEERDNWYTLPLAGAHESSHESNVEQTESLKNLPDDVSRIVCPVGSGFAASGILEGMDKHDIDLPLLGVQVGIDPSEMLDKFAPDDWRERDDFDLVESEYEYETRPDSTSLAGVQVDPIYESKALPYLEPGDLFWVVACRETVLPPDDPRAGITTGQHPDVPTATNVTHK